MYFTISENEILNGMLDRVNNALDKRVGSSLIYNAIAPAAQEIARLRSDMDRFLNYGLVTSADVPEEILDSATSTDGVYRKKATAAIKLGVFKDISNNIMDIPIGSRFSIDKIVYKSIEKIEIGKYKMQCEVDGIQGNYPSGTILPLEYIENLGTAILTDILTEGTDKETNQDLFDRWIIKIQTPSTSGNKYHYLNWALEVNGVGGAKVFPLWNGNGTVKVVIADSNKHSASESLVQETYNYIEEQRPIGATVTVVSAVEKALNITANVTLVNGTTLDVVINNFNTVINDYLKSIAFKTNYLSHAKVGSLLLDTNGVLDYSDLKLNDSTSNLQLEDEEIATLGNINLEVV